MPSPFNRSRRWPTESLQRLPFADVRTTIHVPHLPGHLTGFRQINARIHDVFHIGNQSHRLQRLEKILRVIHVHRRIDNAPCNRRIMFLGRLPTSSWGPSSVAASIQLVVRLHAAR